jgi:replicative DNA helicase
MPPALKPLATFIADHIAQYGKTPDESFVRLTHEPLLDILEGIDLSKATVDALYDATISESVREAIQDYATGLYAEFEDANKSGQNLLDFMEATYVQMRRKYALTQTTALTFSEMSPMLEADYIEALSPTRRGIPIPIYHIANSIGSLEPAQVTTIVAKSGVGKSWFGEMQAIAAATGDPYLYYQPPNEPRWTPEQKAEAAVNSILCSFEMAPIDNGRRLAALASKISFSRIRSGKLTEEEQKSYFDYIRALSTGGDAESTKIGSRIKIIGPESVSSPMQIDAQADDFDAALVILDGFYLMEGPGEKRWEAVQENMKSIRLNSLRSNRHYMLASQLDTRAQTKHASNLDNLSFSSSIVHDSNNIIFMTQTAEQKRARTVDFCLGKARDGQILDPCTYQWDFVNMQFAEIGFANVASDATFTGSSPAISL